MTQLIVVLALLAGTATAAEWPPKKKAPPPPVTANPCTQYGQGFVQLPGTNTCVKVGGSIQVDAGGSSR
jgi:hypothetical protein